MEDLARCHLHPDREAQGQCALCHEYFCESCLTAENTLVFCQEHEKLFKAHQWSLVMEVLTTSETPEAGLMLYHMKEKLWLHDHIPCYITTQYELSASDLIESRVSLMVIDKDKERAEKIIRENS